MKTTTLQPSFSNRGRLKNTQRGMTLIEVLISMFVLAVGVLALLSVQLRAVSGVREAENQTAVAQVTQNMIENMLVNPALKAEVDSAGVETGRVLKSYDHYLSKGRKSTGSKDKDDLAGAQLVVFQTKLEEALPETKVFFTICRDDSGKNPTYTNNAANYQCDDKPTSNAVIKVLWLADAEEKIDSGKLTASDNHIVYTHQSRVTE